jgi:hypothetical protein
VKRRDNKRLGLIAAAKEVCNATSPLGDGSRLILRQRVRGSARAVKALRNTRVFQTETRVVADVSTSKLLFSYIHVIGQSMPGHKYTPAQYALQRIVESLGNLLFEFAEHRLTHTYAVVFRFSRIENIDYLVLRYLNTGALPFEEFSEEWLFDDEV